jgi:DnaJ-class molecular chaperone
MTLSDLGLSADHFKDKCKTCNGDGRVTQFTEINPTMHQVNPPYGGAAMVKCGACDGTGKIHKVAFTG